MAGIFITYIMTRYFNNIYGTQFQSHLPQIPVMCPAFENREFDWTDLVYSTKNGCQVNSQGLRIFLIEFIGTMVFVMAWLILRNLEVEQGQISGGFVNLIKPALVTLAYLGATAVSGMPGQKAFAADPSKVGWN